MEQQESVFVQGAKVLGAAGLAAGVTGAVLGRLVERRREPSVGERLQVALDDVRGAEGSSFVEHLSDAVERARADFEGAIEDSRKRKRKAKYRKKAEEVDFNELAASGLSFAEYMRQVVRDTAERFGENLQDVLDASADDASAASKKAKKRGKSVRKEASAFGKQLLSQAEDLGEDAEKQAKALRKESKKRRKVARKQSREGLDDLMKFRKDASSKAEDRWHEFEGRARETLEDRVKPTLEKAGAATLASAGEARHWLEDESKELEKRYADLKPKLEKSAEHYAASASDLVSELRKVASEHSGDVEHLLQEGAVHARELVHEGADLAHEAGDAAKEGGKNATSLLVWAAIAGGLIYQVLLDDDQKRQVRELATAAFHEGKALLEDVRGQNGDFAQQ